MRTIQILGSGCANCKKLAENAQKAIEGRDEKKYLIIISPNEITNNLFMRSDKMSH